MRVVRKFNIRLRLTCNILLDCLCNMAVYDLLLFSSYYIIVFIICCIIMLMCVYVRASMQ